MFEIPSPVRSAEAAFGSDVADLPLVADSPHTEFELTHAREIEQRAWHLDDPPFGAFAPTPLQESLIELACHTPLGRGRARWWTASLIERLRAGPIDVERLGLKLRLHYYGTHVCDKKMLLHVAGYDREEIDLLTREIDAYSFFRFVDIGAHTGFYSLAVKSMCPNAKIVAFEPHPLYCNRLNYNVRTNALRDFSIRAMAVGAEKGFRPYYVERESLTGDGRFFEVPVVPLHDSLLAEGWNGIDALKIDIEGYEDRALFPFFKTAPRSMWPRIIIIEHTLQHLWELDCFALCRALGYHRIFHGRFNTVLRRI